MDFNHYVIEYPGMFSIAGIKPDIEIDTIFSIRSFPYERILGTSIIYDFLNICHLMILSKHMNLNRLW